MNRIPKSHRRPRDFGICDNKIRIAGTEIYRSGKRVIDVNAIRMTVAEIRLLVQWLNRAADWVEDGGCEDDAHDTEDDL